MQPPSTFPRSLSSFFKGSRQPLPFLQYLRLVKRSRALRGRNPTRNSQIKVRQGRVGPLAGTFRQGPFSCPLDTLPYLRKSNAAKHHRVILVTSGLCRLAL